MQCCHRVPQHRSQASAERPGPPLNATGNILHIILPSRSTALLSCAHSRWTTSALEGRQQFATHPQLPAM
eukprot:5763-Chlamydomonas_euryale.AAC.1